MRLEEQRLQDYKALNPNELTDEQFAKIQQEMKHPKENTISDEYFDFKLWCMGKPSRQEGFAQYLTKRLHRKDARKILEVGCGRTFRLSRMLKLEGFEMTCVDPKIEFVEPHTEGIICVKDRFNFQDDLSEFDFVVAQEPCDATEHVVRACVNQKKPFVMALCGVPHTLLSGEKLTDVYDWYDYLIKLSPNNEIRLRNVSLGSSLRTPILLKD